jgi:hypothetical protein
MGYGRGNAAAAVTVDRRNKNCANLWTFGKKILILALESTPSTKKFPIVVLMYCSGVDCGTSTMTTSNNLSNQVLPVFKEKMRENQPIDQKLFFQLITNFPFLQGKVFVYIYIYIYHIYALILSFVSSSPPNESTSATT